MATPSIDDINKANDLLKQQIQFYNSINDTEKARAKLIEYNNNLKLLETQYLSNINNLTEEEKRKLNDVINKQKSINDELDREEKRRRRNVEIIKTVGQQLKVNYDYLMKSDKVIRQTILNMGLSSAKAELMRRSFEQSASFVTRLGGGLEDIQTIMQGYADETGRSVVLSEEMVKNITLIGKGTGLGIEQATRLGSQFEIIGFNAKKSVEYVQSIVDTSERMGINTTKVLKNINDNFKRLNTYTFQKGSKGIADMAMYAEKFKVDMNQALNAADVSRSLEGAIELAANLQVMGGEFAKTDPFEMLFLSRNDPAKFTEKISEMTRGVYTFRRTAEGTFEKIISPADRDRLAAVSKSLGISLEEITQIAQRRAEIDRLNKDMMGMGLTKREKELIEASAKFNSSSGKFEVLLSNRMQDISKLNKDQIKLLESQKTSLEERAKQALTFDETFKVTIESLKATLLPIVRGFNLLLKPLSGIADAITKLSSWGWGGVAVAAATLLSGAVLFRTVSLVVADRFDKVTKSFASVLNKSKEAGSSISESVAGSVADNIGGGGGKAKRITKNQLEASRIKSKGKLLSGLGAGFASAGIGGGIAIAAVGISKLADSMSKLTDKQAENLKTIAMTMAIAFPAAAVGVSMLGASATAGAVGLVALGAAFTGIGFGVNLAGKGIAAAGDSLVKIMESSKGAGKSMVDLGKGIGLLSLSMAGLSFTGGLGMLKFIGFMKAMKEYSPSIKDVGNSFAQITTVLSGNADDITKTANAIQTISKSKMSENNVFSELSNLLKKPLKVQFDNNKVKMTNDITLLIDGQVLMKKAFDANLVANITTNVRNTGAS